MPFLNNFAGIRRSWRDLDGSIQQQGIAPVESLIGPGVDGLEVAYATADAPAVGGVRDVWKKRHRRAAAPLLMVVGHGAHNARRALVCGPAGDTPPVLDLDFNHARRLAGAALAEPNRHLAISFLVAALDGDPTTLPGLRNKGLLATHALQAWVPQELDWEAAGERSRPHLGLRDHELVRALGFDISMKGSFGILRTSIGRARAVAVLLDATEHPDHPSARFGNQTPVTSALTVADRENLPWVMAVRGGTVRLYSTQTSGAAGQRGRAETYVELNLPVLPTDQAAYLDLLLSAEALDLGGSLVEIQAASADYTSALSKRLRERVYDWAVPRLAVAIADQLGGTTEADLQVHYRTALTILFRLLFLAYAEDSRLLPLHVNGDYTDHALKTRARRIADKINAGHELGFANPLTDNPQPAPEHGGSDLWTDCKSLFRAVNDGAPGWGVPPYNGGLFSTDPTVNPVGNIIDGLTLTNHDFGPALTALTVDVDDNGLVGPIDFRSLSVREFGTIYEGLLGSELAVAEKPLTLDTDDVYVPAPDGTPAVVDIGEVYLHNTSGARKSSGAYFTKPFAVGHLLDRALEPTLTAHLDQVRDLLDSGRDSDAADRLFDFRVADLAMGSGHFLTAVVDRLEARYSTFLVDHPIPRVTQELAQLREAAKAGLGQLADTVEIETSSLLRRLIARRCVYGVDINPMSVELARVSMWIHTFVPGLPLSFLNHNLVTGNSLSGVATIDEATAALTPDGSQASLLDDPVRDALGEADEPLRRLARITDVTTADIAQARKAAADARAAVEPVTRVFDLITAYRLGKVSAPTLTDLDDVDDLLTAAVRDEVALTRPLHFPVAFPEVFLREPSGFDVLIGNPPWEETTVERDAFWALRFPGLRSKTEDEKAVTLSDLEDARPDLVAAYTRELAEAEALRRVLIAGPYPGMGTGDPDLYKAFAWRYWTLLRTGGRTGVVLPRSAMSAKGSTLWRKALLDSNGIEHVTSLTNKAGWVFDDVAGKYTVTLSVLHPRRVPDQQVSLHLYGPYDNTIDYARGLAGPGVTIPADEFSEWTPTASLPLLATEAVVDVFRKLRRHRAVANLPFRYVRELDATNDKKHMVLDFETADLWPVWKGGSFDVWQPDSGVYYAWADPDHITGHLQAKRLRQARRRKGAFYRFAPAWHADPDTLPIRHSRITFRDIARATDSRSCIPCLAPPFVGLANTAPYLLKQPGATARDEAFLLGVMSTRLFDWQVRCTIELHLNLYVLEPLGVPWSSDDSHPGRRRLVEIAGRLAAVDDRYAAWAADVGVPVGSVGDDERDALLVELEALAVGLYGLSGDDLATVYSTFHPTWDHEPFLEAVIARLDGLDVVPVEAQR